MRDNCETVARLRDASTLSEQDESDESLRTRARNFLHNSEKATLAAIENVITRQRVLADVLEQAPGVVAITFHGGDLSPERRREIEKAVDDVRPAGIHVDYQYAGAPEPVNIELRITTDNSLLEQELRAVQDRIKTDIGKYFDGLGVSANGSVNKIVGSVLADGNVRDVRIISVRRGDTDVLERDSGVIAIADVPTTLGELTITDPNLPTMLQVVVSFPPQLASPDSSQIESALQEDIVYLNELNAVERANDVAPEALSVHALSFAKLALALPLPERSRLSLQSFDAAAGTESQPAF